MVKKTIKVGRYERKDGSLIESHDRVIEDTDKSLSEDIKRRKREKDQANLLSSFMEEK